MNLIELDSALRQLRLGGMATVKSARWIIRATAGRGRLSPDSAYAAPLLLWKRAAKKAPAKIVK